MYLHFLTTFIFCYFLAGILNDDGTLNNDASALRLGEVSLAYAQAGKHVSTRFYLLIKPLSSPMIIHNYF